MWKRSNFLNAGKENVQTGKISISLQLYPRLLNIEEDLLGCKHNKHIFLNKEILRNVFLFLFGTQI